MFRLKVKPYVQAVKENIGTYEAKFSFVMAEITSDKEAEYQCELNFATPVQLAVTVEIMSKLMLLF